MHVALRRDRNGRERQTHRCQCRSRPSQRLHLRKRRSRAGDRLLAGSPAISLVRTRAKGDPNPGWVRITWEQALNLAALRLTDIKDNPAPKPWYFRAPPPRAARPSTIDGWVQRLANAFGSPNLLTSNHICTGIAVSDRNTPTAVGMPLPDFDHTQCMLHLGHQSNRDFAGPSRAHHPRSQPRR